MRPRITAAENVWCIKNHNLIAIAAHLSKRCTHALMITNAPLHAIRNEGAKGLKRGLDDWSSIARTKEIPM